METNVSDIDGVEVGFLLRRADATASTIDLLRSLQDDTLWEDSCTIAECIQDVARALEWKHERLVRYMLEIPEEPSERFGRFAEWNEEDVGYLLGQIAEELHKDAGLSPGMYLTVHGAEIALSAHKSGFTDECGEAMLEAIVGIVSHFLTIADHQERKVHPRLAQTMDTIWEAASWVGNEKLYEAD